jgi:hypothetical protein
VESQEKDGNKCLTLYGVREIKMAAEAALRQAKRRVSGKPDIGSDSSGISKGISQKGRPPCWLTER